VAEGVDEAVQLISTSQLFGLGRAQGRDRRFLCGLVGPGKELEKLYGMEWNGIG
jgi:hypothetical protein